MAVQVHALILAGGSGTRFWPWSRRMRPKQLLAIDGEATPLARTEARLEGWIPPERRWVLTRAELAPRISPELPSVSQERAILEPEGRDTAPALVLGALRILAEDPEAALLVLPSDHHIPDSAAFRSAVDRGIAALEAEDALYTFGVTPSGPATGYGYIERGESTAAEGISTVARFTEKPDLATAESYLRSGGHLWNSGIFLWRASTFLEELVRCSPEFEGGIEALEASLRSDPPGPSSPTGEEAFHALPRRSVDRALLERSARVRVVEAGFPWDDLGSWEAVARLRGGEVDGDGSLLDPAVFASDSRGLLVLRPDGDPGGRPIVLHGVEGLLVVETADALLVCPRERSEEVREVVARLREAGLDPFL